MSFIFFWANLVPKSHVLQINWNLVQGYIAICLLWYCFFSEIFVTNVLGQIWFLIWISLNWFKFHRGIHNYVLITMLMFIFFQNSCHLCFFGKFGPISTKWQKLCARVYNYTYYNFNAYFSKLWSFTFFWANLFWKSEFLQIDWNLVQGTLLYAYYGFKEMLRPIFCIYSVKKCKIKLNLFKKLLLKTFLAFIDLYYWYHYIRYFIYSDFIWHHVCTICNSIIFK